MKLLTLKESIFIFFVCFSFTACREMSVNKKIIGKIHLFAVENHEDMNLGYEVPGSDQITVIIGSTVFAIGNDNRYVIVKQHPNYFIKPFSRKLTNYYIVPVSMKNPDYCREKQFIGPLKKEEFDAQIKELHLENIKFTIVNKYFE